MSKNPHTTQILETVGHLVDENRVRGERQDDVDDVEADIKDLKEQIEERRSVLSEYREKLKESEQRCLALINELGMLADGRPRLPNITPMLPTDSLDPADHHSLGELVRFGLTEKQIEKLLGSQLADECTMKSIGDLIRAISNDHWWHRKVKGWGESAVDKATDAINAYRLQHPEPDGDTRPKCCGKCHEQYPQTETECPVCGGTTFELVGDPEDGSGEDPAQPSPPGMEEQHSGELTGATA